MDEIADLMRALGYFPSDYDIECINNEMQLKGKKKFDFEETVKTFLNHRPPKIYLSEVEDAMRNVLNLDEFSSSATIVKISDLVQILTEKGENVSEVIAKSYLKELIGDVNQISLQELIDKLCYCE